MHLAGNERNGGVLFGKMPIVWGKYGKIGGKDRFISEKSGNFRLKTRKNKFLLEGLEKIDRRYSIGTSDTKNPLNLN